MLLAICQWIQETRLSAALSESTWGVPVVGALHVLALALFGGAIILTNLVTLGLAPVLTVRLRPLIRVGVVVLLLTGILLFWSQPVRCYQSIGFRLKLAILLVIALNATASRSKRTAFASITLWIAVIFASRAIAFV